MKLPSFSKKDKPQFLLAALLRDDLVKVIIFEEIENRIKVITTHAENFPTTLEEASIEEWTDTFDKAIGTAENALPEHAELKKTVFGIKQTWVEGTKIKKDYLSKLKKVSDTLDLQPIGFLIFSEAIIHLLQKEQGAPVSGILVEVGKRTAITSIIRAGRIIETKTTPIESTVVAAVEAALKQVTNMEILPSKILLFDGGDVDTIAQAFISYPWNKNLPFLHVPQVTVLSDDFDAKAVIYGTAVQLDMEVEEGDLPKAVEAKPVTPVSEITSTEKPEEKIDKTENKQTLLKSPEFFGFVLDRDIAVSTIPIPAEPAKVEAEVPSESKPEEKEQSMPISSVQPEAIITNPVQEQPVQFDKPKRFRISVGKWTLIIPAILLLLIGGVIWYVMNLKATVILSITPKTVDASQTATFSTKEDNNFGSDTIHADTVTVSEEGNASANTTGSKDIGDKAKGTITIFNISDSSQTITAGTTSTSANGLKFTLDKATVSSGSGDITAPAKVDATVTASDIGSDYNLPSGTKFTISGASPEIAAKNDNAFSGGTKKQITAVAKSDINKLADNLIQSLESKAQSDLKQQAGNGTDVLSVITNEALTKQKADKSPGDEAKTVTLTGTVSYSSLSYSKDDLANYGKTLLKDKVPDVNSLSSGSLMSSVTDATSSAATSATATVKVSASLQPSIDTKQIVQSIKGKPLSEAVTLISHAQQVSDAKITFSPNIPFIPKLLPMSEKNIKIEVQTK